MSKIALLLGLGLCNGGAQTLANEWSITLSEIGIEHKVFYYSGKAYGNECNSGRIAEHFVEFDNFVELKKEIEQYDVCFVFSTPLINDKNHQDFVDMFIGLNTYKIVCIIDRNRNPLKLKRWSEDVVKSADIVFHISGEEHSGYKYIAECNKNTFHADLNLYNWLPFENIAFADKRGYMKISFIGRYVALKGYKQLIKNYDMLPKKFAYTIEGGYFKYQEPNSISSTIGILADICKDIKTKELKDGIVIHSDYSKYYEDILQRGLIHLYPKYKREEMFGRVATSLFTIYPYCKKPGMFRGAIEYTVLESIQFGTPCILSNDYGIDCYVNGVPLIEQDCGLIFYDSFTELDDKIREYCRNYDKNVAKMQKWFSENYTAKEKLKKVLQIIRKEKVDK